MIMIRRGVSGLGWLFFCMFELIGRVVSETDDRSGESWYNNFAGPGHESLFFTGSPPTFVASASLEREYKSNFECWNGTNVWWASVLFLNFSSAIFSIPFFFRSIRSSGLFLHS